MKKIISSLVMVLVLVAVGITTAGAEKVCYEDVCFPGGDASFADSVVSYSSGEGAAPPNTNPSAALGPPDYDGGAFDGDVVSLGRDGVLVVQFTDNSLTTSGSTDEDLWIFEKGTVVEFTTIDISTDEANWIQVGATSGATKGIDIDDYIGSGVILGEQYSYVRITDDGTNNYNPTDGDGGADIDAVGAIESADPVVTTTTTSMESDTTTTTEPDVTTTTTQKVCKDYEVVCKDECCEIGVTVCCGYECCPNVNECCGGICCRWPYICTRSRECVYSWVYEICPAIRIYGQGSEEVAVLRDFRDEVLSQTPVGQEIIKLYYQWSPAIVKAIEADEEFKEEVKDLVDGFLRMVE